MRTKKNGDGKILFIKKKKKTEKEIEGKTFSFYLNINLYIFLAVAAAVVVVGFSRTLYYFSFTLFFYYFLLFFILPSRSKNIKPLIYNPTHHLPSFLTQTIVFHFPFFIILYFSFSISSLF